MAIPTTRSRGPAAPAGRRMTAAARAAAKRVEQRGPDVRDAPPEPSPRSPEGGAAPPPSLAVETKPVATVAANTKHESKPRKTSAPRAKPKASTATINWDGNGSPNSSVVVQLEYAASGSSINSQIFCSFADDGTHDIPANLAARWSDANANGRPQHVHAYRWITTYVAQGTPLMVLIGQYDTDQNVPAAGSRQR